MSIYIHKEVGTTYKADDNNERSWMIEENSIRLLGMGGAWEDQATSTSAGSLSQLICVEPDAVTAR